MATQTTKTVQLPNMKIAAKQLEAIGGHINIGPVTISYSLDLSKPDIDIEVSILGITLLDVELDPQNPTVEIDLDHGGVGVKGSITANFSAQELDGDLRVDYVFGHKEWKGTIFRWGNAR